VFKRIHHCRHLSMRSFALSASNMRPFFISSKASFIPFFGFTSVNETTSLNDSRRATSFFQPWFFHLWLYCMLPLLKFLLQKYQTENKKPQMNATHCDLKTS